MPKKLLLSLVLLLALLPLTPLHAQDSAESKLWRWPELGLSMEYPADWSFALNQNNFVFVLFAPQSEDATSPDFVGLQLGNLGPDESVATYFEAFSQQTGVAYEETSFGNLQALSLETPKDVNGFRGRLIGFAPSETQIALLIFYGAADNWDAFQATIESILASAEVAPLALDTERLNAQMQSTLAEEGVLGVGDMAAPVRVMEVLDFSCPHCVDYSNSVSRLVQDYELGEKADVRLIFNLQTFVGGEVSQTAALAAYCAAELGRGWDFHKALFALYESNGRAAYSAESIQRVAASVELDGEALATCISDKRYADALTRDAQTAEALGVTGTPAILFARGDEEFAFLTNSRGEALGGGLPLVAVYDHLDNLLAE
jgi:protein-disulfide isomerase